MQVAIVGDRNSGKTTFLGLLYVAQVKSGSDRADRFRFHAAFDSLEEITAVFQRLMSGNFPDSSDKEGIRELSVHLGYRRAGRAFLSRLRPRGWAPDASATLRFVVLKTFEEEVSRFLKGSVVASGRLRDILEGDAIAILVDSSKLAIDGEDAERGAMERYDGAVEGLLGAIQQWRRGDRRTVYPILILSKFDRIRPEVLRGAKVDSSPPDAGKASMRTAYGEALLARCLPKTFKKIRARERGQLAFAPPAYFFSWVRTEGTSTGQSRKIRLRRAAASGWEPEYAMDEYIALLTHLSEVAARIKR